jgi:hypothetical protein
MILSYDEKNYLVYIIDNNMLNNEDEVLYFKVEKNNKFNYIDSRNRVICNTWFDDVSEFDSKNGQ